MEYNLIAQSESFLEIYNMKLIDLLDYVRGDILLAEVKNNNNAIEEHDGYTFVFSTNVTQDTKDKADKIRKEQDILRNKHKVSLYLLNRYRYLLNYHTIEVERYLNNGTYRHGSLPKGKAKAKARQGRPEQKQSRPKKQRRATNRKTKAASNKI